MEYLDDNKYNVLIITEGKLEKTVFKKISDIFNLNLNIYNATANIYSFYNRIKKIDDFGYKPIIYVIKDDLNETLDFDLPDHFDMTFLIFDFDPQNSDGNYNDFYTDVILKNVEMISYFLDIFVDFSDEQYGQVIINYPTMDNIFENINNYNDAVVNLLELENCKYKDYIYSKTKFSERRNKSYINSKFNYDLYMSIFNANCRKLNAMINNNYDLYLNCNKFMKDNKQNLIFEKQKQNIVNDKILKVLNTSIFLPSIIYGNKLNFFNNVEFGLSEESKIK